MPDWAQQASDALDDLGDSPTPAEARAVTDRYEDTDVMAALAARGGGGGGGSQPGTVIPNADPTGAMVDDTTYDNAITGTGKYTTLVVPENTGVVAIAIDGDDFPRIVVTPEEGSFWMGDGVTDDPTNMAAVCYSGTPNTGKRVVGIDRSLKFSSGAGLSSRSGSPTANAVGGNKGDLYIDMDGDPTANTYLYVCTVAGAPGAATWIALVTS